MAGRSPARFLAPIALLAFAFALYTLVNDGRQVAGDSGSSGSPASVSPTATATKKASKKSTRKRTRTYTIKPGDTLSGIAQRTGVDATKLQQLNPKLDPSALSPGQRIKLR